MRVTEGPFEWPLPDEAVHAALEAAYYDGSWGRYHGPNCEALTAALEANFAREHALLCSSGTIGVELALRGCGIEPGDEVVLSGYDFPGNFRAIEAVGARPVLVDIEPNTWCLSVDQLWQVQSPKVRAVIASHLHGGLADVACIVEFAHERGWAVVEDACQQPGARIANRPVGSWGDVSVLSFGGSKLLTAGRGGAVLTDDAQLLQRIKVYADRGNNAFPLSELQAAVLSPQLEQLGQRNRTRSERVEEMLQMTSPLNEWLHPVEQITDGQPAYYKLAWSFVPAEEEPQLRDRLITALHAAGAPIDAGFRGFARRSERRCDQIGELPASKRLSQSTLLLHHPILLAQKKAAQQVCQVLDYEVRRLVS